MSCPGTTCRNTYYNYGSYLRSRGYDKEICNLVTEIENGNIKVGNIIPNCQVGCPNAASSTNSAVTINGTLCIYNDEEKCGAGQLYVTGGRSRPLLLDATIPSYVNVAELGIQSNTGMKTDGPITQPGAPNVGYMQSSTNIVVSGDASLSDITGAYITDGILNNANQFGAESNYFSGSIFCCSGVALGYEASANETGVEASGRWSLIVKQPTRPFGIGSDYYSNVTIPYLENKAGGTAITVDSAGRLYKDSSSSKKFKFDIKDLSLENAKNILSVKAKNFKYISDPVQEHSGLIAEELHENEYLKRFVIYDAKSKPESINYTQLVVPLLEVIRDNEKRISNLEKLLQNALEVNVSNTARIATLENK